MHLYILSCILFNSCSINATKECADKTMSSLEAFVHYLPGTPRDLPSLVEVLLLASMTEYCTNVLVRSP